MLKTFLFICVFVCGWLVIEGGLFDDHFDSMGPYTKSNSTTDLIPERVEPLKKISNAVKNNSDFVPELTPERIQLLRSIAGVPSESAISSKEMTVVDSSFTDSQFVNHTAASYESNARAEIKESYLVVDEELPGQNWVFNQDANHYTLQLALTVDRPFLMRFAERLPPGFDAVVYPERVTETGSVQYSLSAGSFSSKELAQAALKDLSSDIRRYGAYARKFEEIHNTSI